MKKFFSLVLALVMALSLTTVAWGADPLTSSEDLQDAINNGATEIVLGEGEFTVNLYDIAARDSLTITGQGAATKINFARPQVRLDLFNSFTISNCTIGKMVDKSWGQLVFSAGKDGGVYTVSNCIFNGESTQGIYINPAAGNEKYVIEGCTFTGDFGSEGAVTVQNHSQPTTLTVSDNNNFDVDDDSEELSIHYHKAALTLNSNVEETVLIKDGDGCTAAQNFEKAVANADAGDTFKLMADVTLATPVAITKPLNIDNNGNDLVGMPASTTEGTNVTTDASGKLTSGTFAAAPAAADVADGYTVLANTDGTYVVVPAVTMGDKFDLYVADAGMNAALKAKTPDVAGLSFEEVAAKTNKDGSGRVAYIAANNGQFFVKASNPTVADYAVTDAGKNTVLYYVTVAGTSAANFEYEESVTAFTAFSSYAKCGSVTGTPVAGKTYFMASDDLVYMAGAAGTGTNYLLNGKVVSGVYAGTPETHTFVANGYKYDTTLKTNVPTSALCTKCMTTSTAIYKDGKAPAQSTVYELTTDTAYCVVAGAASAPVVGGTTTDTKVESAQTFDAGIAMYVGMSVMAAAGSAVVLKKRED